MTTALDTLYYYGQCHLCNAEMERLGAAKDGSLQLVDIHTLADLPELPSRDQLLKKLHLQTARGDLLVGLEANIAAWEHTALAPRWRLLRLPLIRQLAEFGYTIWARWRYRRLYGNPEL